LADLFNPFCSIDFVAVLPLLEQLDIWPLDLSVVDKDKGDMHTVSELSYHSIVSIKPTKNLSAAIEVHYNRKSFIAAIWRSNYCDRYVFAIRAARDGTVLYIIWYFCDRKTSLSQDNTARAPLVTVCKMVGQNYFGDSPKSLEYCVLVPL
jgi:hypothetical protein